MAYRILNRTGLFQKWIIDWNTRPQIQKTWANFKSHFRKAHQQLKETSNLQVQDSSYHANSIKEMIQDLRAEIHSKYTSPSTADLLPPITIVSSASSDSSISALQNEVASLKDYIHNMQQYQMPPPPPFCHPQSPSGQSYCSPVNPYQAYANQASTYPIQQEPPRQYDLNNNKRRRMYYCWTHGDCYHPGVKCRKRENGHQDGATFQNRMEGSIKNVRGVSQPWVQ